MVMHLSLSTPGLQASGSYNSARSSLGSRVKCDMHTMRSLRASPVGLAESSLQHLQMVSRLRSGQVLHVVCLVMAVMVGCGQMGQIAAASLVMADTFTRSMGLINRANMVSIMVNGK